MPGPIARPQGCISIDGVLARVTPFTALSATAHRQSSGVSVQAAYGNGKVLIKDTVCGKVR